MANPLAEDLDRVLELTEGLWEELRGQRIFISGGTGFFGCWLLESFVWANEKLALDASVLVLTRDVEAFRSKAPHLADCDYVAFHVGDVRSFDFPPGHYSHVIHAATDTRAGGNEEEQLLLLDTIVQGTRRMLDFACRCGARRFLLTSSGAVYGRQPPEMTHVQEAYGGGPDPADPHAAYAEGKRVAELLCTLYGQRHDLDVKIARCFAFMGPYMPLDAHFAAGNFIRDALEGDPIRVKGDGSPYRSYLYAADLAVWLWTILFRGRRDWTYNVGSEESVTIGEMAHAVAEVCADAPAVQIAKRAIPGAEESRYVPATRRAREELGLSVGTELREAIARTVAWHRVRTVHR